MRNLKYLKNIATLKLDPGKCTGCTICTLVCPHAVFEMKNKKAVIKDLDACMECGACTLNCQYEAISVDSGVGCAAAVISGMLGRTDAKCCCVQEIKKRC
ncbi:MAG: 4Fe-4S binding protein [Spirochaetes bacterium]|nr:4Fe-4S binding protein [Spirochaetota bacterium]